MPERGAIMRSAGATAGEVNRAHNPDMRGSTPRPAMNDDRTNAWYSKELIRRGWIKPSGEPVYPREPRPGLLDFCEWPLLTLKDDDALAVTWRVSA